MVVGAAVVVGYMNGSACVCFSQGKSSRIAQGPKSQNVQMEVIDSMVRVTETTKPCGSRALGSRTGPSHSAEWWVLPSALHPPS